MTATIKLAPSIFAANIANLKEQIEILEKNQIEMLHVDVMDGHFVDRMAFGADHIKMLKSITTIPLDVHLMIEKPEKHLAAIIQAGADIITIHYESTTRLYSCVEQIKASGHKAGVVLNPGTHEIVLQYLLDKIDMVLLMTVNPGEGGQSFLPDILEKIRNTKAMIQHRPIDLEVDGGINDIFAKQCVEAGANVFVAGGYLFNGDLNNNIKALRQALGGVYR